MVTVAMSQDEIVATHRGIDITLSKKYGTYNAECPKTGRTMADGCLTILCAKSEIDWTLKMLEDFRQAEIAYAAKMERWRNATQDDTPALESPWWHER